MGAARARIPDDKERFMRCRFRDRITGPASLIVLWMTLWTTTAQATLAQSLEYRVILDSRVSSQPVSCTLYVMLGSSERAQPRFGPDWFNPEPFFAIEVTNWKPEEVTVVGGDAFGFPSQLASLPKATYSIQAV